MELKGRLKLIADKVPKCNYICDIGTDHAYIPIYLVLNNICNKAVAADVGVGPIKSATENIDFYHLDNRIEARVGYGLDPVREDEAEVVVIAGMGGTLINNILERGFNKAKGSTALVLQPMNAIEELREWLYGNGFDIYDEELINEGEKIYNVIAARWTGISGSFSEIYYHVGKKLIDKKDPLLCRFLNKRIKNLDKSINEMQRTDKEIEAVKKRHMWLRDEMKNILENLAEG